MRFCVIGFGNWMLEEMLLAGVSAWDVTERKGYICHAETMLRNNHGNNICAWQVERTGYFPYSPLSQLPCSGRKAGDQAAGQLWGVKDLSFVKKRECLVVLVFPLYPSDGLGMSGRSQPFAQQRGDVWLHGSGWLVLSSLAKMAFLKPKGASAGRGQGGGGGRN